MKLKQNTFDKGLLLGLPVNSLPLGYLRRARGMARECFKSFRSRYGSSLLASLDAHSITYFAGSYYYGVSSLLYKETASIKTGLSGNRLTFSIMPSLAGLVDNLFIAGGGELIKSDSDGNVSSWGIAEPDDGTFSALETSLLISIINASYKWTLSGSGTNEYYLEAAAGGDPSVSDPTLFLADGEKFEEGTLGSLGLKEYKYGDNDTLGYNTLYVRLEDESDPDTQAVDFLQYSTATDFLSNGDYSYYVTFKNSTLGIRSNSNPTAVDVSISYEKVTLQNIPQSADSQVDKIEIWRTGIGGTAYFYLDEIAHGVTTYIDDGTVELSALELPTDNNKPYDWFDDCLGPHNASMFWITRTQSIYRGRVYYSPIGRPESYSGFINVCADDKPLQKLFRFQGQLGVIGEGGIYIISGENPYLVREISGCPGTVKPHTVAVIPSMGVVYEAADGLRIFDGATSALLGVSEIKRIFDGVSLGDLSAFSGVVANYARGEYLISDESQTIALNFTASRWRDLGFGTKAIFYNEETNALAINKTLNVLNFESPTATNDNGTAISLSFEPAHIQLSEKNKYCLSHITIDINTNDETLSAYITTDESEHSAISLSTTTRKSITLFSGVLCNSFGIRLSGNLNDNIEIFEIVYSVFDIVHFPDYVKRILQYIVLDVRTGNDTIDLKLNVDNVAYAISTLPKGERTRLTIPIGKSGKDFYAYFTASTFSEAFELYAITYIFNDQTITIPQGAENG